MGYRLIDAKGHETRAESLTPEELEECNRRGVVVMDDEKRKRLESKGWKVGGVDEFLNDYSEYFPQRGRRLSERLYEKARGQLPFRMNLAEFEELERLERQLAKAQAELRIANMAAQAAAMGGDIEDYG